METKEYVYNGQVVEFFFSDDIMVNATEMAAVFGKRSVEFLRLSSTKKWINWLEKSAIRANRSGESALRFAGNMDLPGEIVSRSADLVPILVVQKGGGEGGTTWMHRLLAIEFAMWLDIDFKGWVILKIDGLLYDFSMGTRTLVIKSKQVADHLQSTLNEHSNNPIIKSIIDDMDTLKQLKGDKLNLNKNFNKGLFD